MRVVVWNCNMGLQGKFPLLEALQPAVAVISEASAPERLAGVLGERGITSVWAGRSRLKGLAMKIAPAISPATTGSCSNTSANSTSAPFSARRRRGMSKP